MSDKVETVTGESISVVMTEQVGETHWQVFRPADGELRVIIRQPTGYVDTTVKNIEKLICKLAQMHEKY